MKINTFKLAQLSLLISIAVVFTVFFRIPFVGPFSFLVFDVTDVVIVLVSLFYGNLESIIVLFVISIFQALFFSFDGFIGFFMHFLSSSTMILSLSYIYRRLLNKLNYSFVKSFFIASVVGIFAMSIVMLPINLFVLKYLYPIAIPCDTAIKGIVCFNLLKGGINCTLAALISKILKPVLNEIKK